MPPLLILITGLPATGKSTLAEKIAASIGLPLFGKDQFKETLFDTLGIGDRQWSRSLSIASVALLFEVLRSELRAGRSCIIESNFHPELDLVRMQQLQSEFQFRCIQILCVADGHVLLERYKQRPRHPGHLDALMAHEIESQLLTGRLEPLAFDSLLIEVDTTDPGQIDFAALLAKIDQFLQNEPQ